MTLDTKEEDEIPEAGDLFTYTNYKIYDINIVLSMRFDAAEDRGDLIFLNKDGYTEKGSVVKKLAMTHAIKILQKAKSL